MPFLFALADFAPAPQPLSSPSSPCITTGMCSGIPVCTRNRKELLSNFFFFVAAAWAQPVEMIRSSVAIKHSGFVKKGEKCNAPVFKRAWLESLAITLCWRQTRALPRDAPSRNIVPLHRLLRLSLCHLKSSNYLFSAASAQLNICVAAATFTLKKKQMGLIAERESHEHVFGAFEMNISRDHPPTSSTKSKANEK